MLVSVCGGIVLIDNENVIRLVHYTTQEYFERNRNELFPNAPTTIASNCLTYLAFDVFDVPCSDRESLSDRLAKYKFGRYAAQYWGAHTRGDAGVEKFSFDVFQSEGKRSSMCQIVKHYGFSLLHVIAANGLATVCPFILSEYVIGEETWRPKTGMDGRR